ncbi:MAG: YitT family protein [Bacilli bacterium]
MKKSKIQLFKEDWRVILKNYTLIVVGSILLAVGTGVFLLPAVLNTGGLSGIGIIGEGLFSFDPDLVVLVMTWVFFLISLLFLGWRFTIKSLVSSFVYPLALILLMRLPAIATETTKLFGEGADMATKLIAGVFGGVFNGVGVALTFRGGGSTGGVDILVVILNKYLRLSYSIMSFVIDGLIIVIGLVVLKNVLLSLVGIMSAFVFAITLEFVFVGKSHAMTASIISRTHSEDINTFIQNEIGQGTTLVSVMGGYQKDEYTMVVVHFDRSNYARLINGVAKIDKNAFVSIEQSTVVLGGKFESLKPVKEGLVNIKKKDEKDKT